MAIRLSWLPSKRTALKLPECCWWSATVMQMPRTEWDFPSLLLYQGIYISIWHYMCASNCCDSWYIGWEFACGVYFTACHSIILLLVHLRLNVWDGVLVCVCCCVEWRMWYGWCGVVWCRVEYMLWQCDLVWHMLCMYICSVLLPSRVNTLSS